MKRFLKIASLFFIMFGLGLNAATQEQSRLFSIAQLQNNETLSIAYRSQGCFSRASDGIIFKTIGVSTTRLKDVPILPNELSKIDKYLNRLASQKESSGSCTTEITLLIELKRNDEIIHSARLVDRDCPHFFSIIGNDRDEMTIDEVLIRANETVDGDAEKILDEPILSLNE
jgi:hypothetical protein